MANIDNPTGFYYDGRFSDLAPPIKAFEMAESTTLSNGDPVKFSGGYVDRALTSEGVIGVFLGPEAEDRNVESYPGNNAASSITTGVGENPRVSVVLAMPDVYFRVQDANALAAITNRGTKVDFSGASGAAVVDSSVTLNGDCLLIDKAGTDNINGNEYGANMDWIVQFANSPWKV